MESPTRHEEVTAYMSDKPRTYFIQNIFFLIISSSLMKHLINQFTYYYKQ